MSPPPPPPPVHIAWSAAHHGPPSRLHGWSNQVAGTILADPDLRHRGREEMRDAVAYQEDERNWVHDNYGHRPWWRPRVHWRHHFLHPHHHSSHNHSRHGGFRWPWRSHSSAHSQFDTGHHHHHHHDESSQHDVGHHHHGLIPELQHHLDPRPWLWFTHRCHPYHHGMWNRFFGWLLNDEERWRVGKMEEEYARKERANERARRRENQNREFRRLAQSWDRPYTL